MSVQKAEFRAVEPVTKSGVRIERGHSFVAGVGGRHVGRWMAEGKIVLVKRIGGGSSAPRPATARRPLDRTARVLGLLVLATALWVATGLRPRLTEDATLSDSGTATQLAIGGRR